MAEKKISPKAPAKKSVSGKQAATRVTKKATMRKQRKQ